jgi:hypothetical protein
MTKKKPPCEEFKLYDVPDMEVARIENSDTQLHIHGHTIDVVLDEKCPRDQIYLFGDKNILYVHPEDLDSLLDLVPGQRKSTLNPLFSMNKLSAALKEAYKPELLKIADSQMPFMKWLTQPDNSKPPSESNPPSKPKP